MALFLIELAFVGLFFVVVFFVKLSSAPPALKAAIIGVRIILALSILGVGIYFGKKYLDDVAIQNAFEKELQKFSPVGSWFYKDGNDHILKFEADSSFIDSYNNKLGQDINDYGNYKIYKKDEKTYIKLNYDTKTKIFEITAFDGQEILLHEETDRKEGEDIKMIKR